MEALYFSVQGSANEPYLVTFYKSTNNLSASCTCQAGTNGQCCKHRVNILNGSISGIVSNNVADVRIVTEWLPGTPLERALNDVLVAEQKLELAKHNLTKAKKTLAKACLDR